MDQSRHHHRHRFPSEIVGRPGRLHFRYSLSYLDIEEMMFERGLTVSCETILVVASRRSGWGGD
jgi:transposase-like protein